MKILLLTVSAGYGHHAAAESLSEALQLVGCETVTLDLFKYIGIGTYQLVEKGYEAATKYIPKPYGLVFNHKSRRTADQHRTIDSRTVRLSSAKILRYIEAQRPDVVVCTHVFGAMVMDELKRKKRVRIPTVGLLTDYEFHPFWEDVPEIEHIIVGSSLLDVKAARRGIDTSKLVALGIPVARRFTYTVDKEEARRRLGVGNDRFTVLVMGGSMGYGDMEGVVASLSALGNIQLLCVCGKNEKLKQALEKMRLPNAEIYGFAKNVELLMDAADCIVTKPGGLSTTEAMSKRLPMVLFNPIPGQEERNMEFLCGAGTAIMTTRDYPPDEAVRLLMLQPERAAEMRRAAERVVPPDSAALCAELIKNLAR